MTFENELLKECGKLVSRFEYYARELRDDDKRRDRRTGQPHFGKILRPSYWDADSSFNPYRVRASSEAISRAIRLGLRSHTYQPFNPIAYAVPKADGSKRIVSVFPVADATVSLRTYKSLLFKNRSRFSAYSYAYRDDLTAHDAIQHISVELTGRGRMFLAEYDFSKYFDSISHEYLWRIIDEKQFLMTTLERHVLESFLATDLQEGQYSRHTAQTSRKSVGVP